ncbi:MAG TPA: proteasome activator [Acidimicrobiia bacterium]
MENDPSAASAPVQPEVIQQAPAPADDAGDGSLEQEQVTRPTKLIRIASMVRNMLEEVRRAPIDDSGRRALREIHERSIHELEDVLSPDLKEELCEVVLPFRGEAPTESELRLAQAQLVGWLEGLFHGIQATLFTQQAAAQSQLDEMRRRALQSGQPPPQQQAPPGSGYL